MAAQITVEPFRPGNVEDVVQLPLHTLRIGPSLRERGVDPAHVKSLRALEGRWPPVLISVHDNTVIDGVHRFHAARSLGLTKIACVYFTDGPDAAYLEFVRRNTHHGLALTLRERERAARSILALHGEWSDRRIAEFCGVSAGTVARIRKQLPTLVKEPASARSQPSNERVVSRIGKDGRSRPVDSTATRARIATALEANPESSLRAIAAIVGASPETVRTVRAEMQGRLLAGPHSEKQRSRKAGSNGFEASHVPDRDSTNVDWAPDVALTSTQAGTQFVRWFEETSVGDNWREHVSAIPLSRVYEIADQARGRAAQWSAFADALESRIAGRRAARV